MNTCKIYTLAFLAICCFTVNAQQNNKVSLLFHRFNYGAYPIGKSYQTVLYDKTLNNLVSLNKFNIVNRTPEMLKAIETELAFRDFIDSRAAMHVGEMLGAQYYVEGTVSNFSCDRTFRSASDQTVSYTYICRVNASLKIINLETGLYDELVIAETVTENPDQGTAMQSAIENIASDLAKKLGKKFLIRATVKSIFPPDLILINKGARDGIKPMDSFIILRDTDSTENNSMGEIKVMRVSDHEATARLLHGDVNALKAGYKVLESSAETAVNTGKIEKKDRTEVIINGGKDIGIKRGDIFTVLTKEETQLGDRIVTDDKIVGRIYIKEVKKDYSKGKILNGHKYIKKGSPVSQTTELTEYKTAFLRLKYKSSINKIIKANQASGIVSVVNRAGQFDVDTKYMNTQQNIEDINIIPIGLGGKNLMRDFSTTLSFDIYNMAPLHNWIFHIDWDYEYPLVPEKLNVIVGGSLGYGRLKQEIPDNIVSIISEGSSNELVSHSAFISGQLGLSYTLGRFSMGSGISFDYMSYNKWTYDLNIDDKETKERAPDQIIPYRNVNLTGLYYNVSLSYTFKK